MSGLMAVLCLCPALPERVYALGREWKHIKRAETYLDNENLGKAERELEKALAINSNEPKIHEDFSILYVIRDELDLARESIEEAIFISKKKAARFSRGRAKKAWDRYLALLYSFLFEISVLEEEKVLRPGLLGGRKTGGRSRNKGDFEKAVEKIKFTYEKILEYGVFTSQVEDPLIQEVVKLVKGSSP